MQKKTIEQIHENKCVGCSACYSACNTGAIDIKQNKEGFYFPYINQQLCNGCGLCYKVCPVNSDTTGECANPAVYALQNKSEDILKISSSGGVFYEIARYILEQNGIIYGCSMENNIAVHKRVCDIENLKQLTGSKYVQSKVMCFENVKEDLNNGLLVLFCGTPCQVSGLLSFLKKKYANLICVDFICHGVPSPLVLEKYIDDLEQKNNKKIDNVKFRSKIFGWENFAMSISSGTNEILCEPRNKNLYLKCFLANISIRKSCGTCKYNTLPRSSDITLGDFWEIKIDGLELDADKGISLITLNTDMGSRIFESIKNKFVFYEKTLDEVKIGNPFINGHCKLSGKRGNFFNNLNNMPIEQNIRESLVPTLTERIIEIAKYKINQILKR